MPGRSSTAKDEPDRMGTPSSLQGATGGTVGGTNQGNSVINPMMGSPANMHTTASVAEGACFWWENLGIKGKMHRKMIIPPLDSEEVTLKNNKDTSLSLLLDDHTEMPP